MQCTVDVYVPAVHRAVTAGTVCTALVDAGDIFADIYCQTLEEVTADNWESLLPGILSGLNLSHLK